MATVVGTRPREGVVAMREQQVFGDGAGVSRRTVVRAAGGGSGLWLLGAVGGRAYAVEAPQAPSGTADAEAPARLDAGSVPKFVAPLAVPPVMPRTGRVRLPGGAEGDLYEVSVRQLTAQVLPPGMPATTVWGYGPLDPPPPGAERGPGREWVGHGAPSAIIETVAGRPVRVRWVNELVDADGRFLPHLLPVDQTLHWANPPGGEDGRDGCPTFAQTPGPYRGPVPVVTHLHGAVGVGEESDGYPEAWYLPEARDLPPGHARVGTWFDRFAERAHEEHGVGWGPGHVTYHYPNDQRAGTNWFHDHTLGMTRATVYAGPAGFWLVRGGPGGDDAVLDSRTGRPAVLPGPAPREGDPFPSRTAYREVSLAIADRAFHEDGSLFYPDTRAHFDGVTGPYLPEGDVPPIWNPEFFGDVMVVNGRAWPVHEVEQRRYRFRVLNGCNSRTLDLDFGGVPGVSVWQVGTEGGFLAAAVDVTAGRGNRLLLAPAERVDLVVDFADVPLGRWALRNVGPDGPFSGEVPEDEVADPRTTGQVLAWRVVPRQGHDRTTPPRHLVLPALGAPGTGGARVRRLALLERMSESAEGEEAPVAALLGTIGPDGRPTPRRWMDEVTEDPVAGQPEVWEIHNLTADAHPIHVHTVMFRILDRRPLEVDEDDGRVQQSGPPRPPEPGEQGWKDTVVAYPEEVTRLAVRFGEPGRFVWHCHVLEHEDNEMMRPLQVRRA
ncbi:MAG TPA: multicopper oxidase domain-containing protein [Dermatophilaceae bacterium]|nr:multicopper oxidase domain-containing protein [Dermatophilaceae bacterium]